jgi:hypothetical protein
MTTAKFVRKYYAPIAVHCMPGTDGGYGIFAANADITKWPHVLGLGRTEIEAWKHAKQRIDEAPNEH